MNYLKRVLNFLTSRFFAIILLIISLVLVLAGMVLPQDSQIALTIYTNWFVQHPGITRILQAFGLSNIYGSWIFYLVISMLFLSTFFCTWRQFRKAHRLKQSVLNSSVPLQPPYKLQVQDAELNAVFELIAHKKGYRSAKLNQKNKSLIAYKNGLGFWGSPVFHLALSVIILGTLITGLTKMSGYLLIGEGQVIAETPSSYLSLTESHLLSAHKGFLLKLDKLNIIYPTNAVPYVTSLQLSIQDAQTISTYTLTRGQLLDYDGVKLVPDVRGYAVGLVLTDHNNKELGGGFYHLRTSWPTNIAGSDRELAPIQHSENYTGSFSIDQDGLSIDASFYPDSQIINQKIIPHSLKPVNPVIALVVRKGGTVIYNGPLKLNGKVRIDQNKYLYFAAFRNNMGIQVSREYGTPVVFGGFALLVVGLFLIYMLPPKIIWLQTAPDGFLHLWVRVGRLPDLSAQEAQEISQLLNPSD